MGMEHRWFALRVRPRAEKAVASTLRGKGFEEFLPLHRQKRRWSDRVKQVDLPLFPGYVFSRFELDKRQPILTIPGVLHVVGFGRTPHPIDETEMSSLMAVVDSHRTVQPWPHQFVGERVRVTDGPLAGVEGTLSVIKANRRIVVTISLLQRSVAVELPEEYAWPAGSSTVLLSAF